VIGMDFDHTMIDKAREQFPDVDFFVGDVRNFQLNEPVDILFSNAALHWIPKSDAGRAVRAMSVALAPCGQFVVELGGKGNVDAIVRAVQDVLNLPRSQSPWYFPGIAEYTNLMEANAIETKEAILFERPTRLEGGQDGVRNWLRMFGNSFFEGMSNEEIDGVLDRVCDVVRPELYDDDTKSWIADYVRLRVIGRKL